MDYGQTSTTKSVQPYDLKKRLDIIGYTFGLRLADVVLLVTQTINLIVSLVFWPFLILGILVWSWDVIKKNMEAHIKALYGNRFRP